MNFKKVILGILAILPGLNTLTMDQNLGKRQFDDNSLAIAKKQKPEASETNWFEYLHVPDEVKLQILGHLLQSSPRLLVAFQQLGKIAQLDKSFYELAYSQDAQKIFERSHLQNKVKSAWTLPKLLLSRAPNNIINFVLGINGFLFGVDGLFDFKRQPTFDIGLTNTTALHQIVSKGLSYLLSKLIKNNDKNKILTCINYTDSFGLMPIHYVFKNKDQSCVDILKNQPNVQINAHIKSVDNDHTQLMSAAANNDLEQIKFLLKNNVNINERSKLGITFGITALMAAVRCGNLEAVKLLLDNGADINAADLNCNTALMYACENEHLSIVRELLKKSPDLDDLNKQAQTALSIAVIHGFFEIAKELIEHKAPVNNLSFEYSPLMYAAEYGHLDLANLLIDHGANVDEYIDSETTALTFAIDNNHLDMVELLIRRGAKIDIIQGEGEDKIELHHLCYAVNSGKPEIASFLIRNGADVNAEDPGSNKTPLIEACIKGYIEIVKQLLAKGAKANSFSLEYALFNNHVEIAEILVNHGVKFNEIRLHSLISHAIENGYIQVLEFLKKNNVNVNTANEYGFTSLMQACKHGKLEIVKFLLNNEANIHGQNQHGISPLLWAIAEGHFDIVQLLIEKGANINSADMSKFTPLMYAAYRGYKNIVQFLLNNDADVKKITQHGKTALSLAQETNRIEIVEILQEHIDKENAKLELANQQNCAICLGEFEAEKLTKVLNCGHKFHKDCANVWLKDHNFCPYCKKQQ